MYRHGFPVLRRHGRVITLLALMALWLGQSLAVAHASRHVGGDASRLPANHAQLCTDCASIAPLLAVAGGSACPLLVPAPRTSLVVTMSADVTLERAFHYAFRSRAPPR